MDSVRGGAKQPVRCRIGNLTAPFVNLSRSPGVVNRNRAHECLVKKIHRQRGTQPHWFDTPGTLMHIVAGAMTTTDEMSQHLRIFSCCSMK